MADIAKLSAALPKRYRPIPWVAVGSGLRLSEILGLTVDRVDFLRRTITVDRQMVTAKGKPPHLAPPKTGASHRVVPVAQETIDLLAAHLSEFPAGELGLIFTSERGPIRLNTMEGVLLEARTEAKVTAHFHAIRHTYASILIAAGANVKVVQERLGHKSAALTLDTYSHLFDDQHDATRDMMSAALQGQMPAALRIASDDG
jgi:integrase